MRYTDDHELVSIDVEDSRVVGITIKNNWRNTMSVAELGLELSNQLSRAWAEPAIKQFREMSIPTPVDTMPAALQSLEPQPAVAGREPDLKQLMAISEELAAINTRIREKLHNPNYFSDLTPPTGQEFTSRDGNVTLGHFGKQVVGITLRETYFDRANIMSVNETILTAFEEFYGSDHSDEQALTEDYDPELTADRRRLAAIQHELEEV